MPGTDDADEPSDDERRQPPIYPTERVPEGDADDDAEYVGWFLPVDPMAAERAVADYRLFLCPHPGGERFDVFRCTRDMRVPAGTMLLPAESVEVVWFGTYQFNVLPCMLIHPEIVERYDAERLLPFPPELVDEAIPAQEALDEELFQLLMGPYG